MNTPLRIIHLAAILLSAQLWLLFSNSCNASDKELWIYCPANFLLQEECQRVHAIMERAAKAGYTHVMVTDSKFSRLSVMDKRYFDNIEQLKSKAAKLNLKLVPACCPVGYSNDLLSLDPNMAEGLPVRDSLYRVENNTATHIADPKVYLPPLTERKKWGFIDDLFEVDGNDLVATAKDSQNARVMKAIKTQRFQQYHASVWIKTENLSSQIEIKARSLKDKDTSYTYLNTKPTQDWTQHHVTFNSLDNEELNFYIGAWALESGKFWLRDAKIESTGAVNLVRRATAPIEVQLVSEQGKVALKENVDFERWSDPKLGVIGYAGQYEPWHTPPPIRLKRKLPDGSQLLVSYFHTHIIHGEQVCGTIGDAIFESFLKQQASAIGKLFPTSDYMMSHDEYRLMNWTKHTIPGLRANASPAELLTHNAKVCFEAIQLEHPLARVLTWSDMFDPYHNAVDNYFLVNGSLKSSQLPQQVVVVNWNFEKKAESVKHFESLGHHQIIAGYYDPSPYKPNKDEIVDWLDTVVDQKLQHVDGVMYTTWHKNYRDVEDFARNVKKHRWYANR